MPGNRQDRFVLAKEIRSQRPTPDNATKSRQSLRTFLEIPRRLKRQLEKFARQFDQVEADTLIEKRTAYFDSIVAAGSIELLHDMAEGLDAAYAFVNDFKAPSDPDAVQPFTDANVTYYEANGVSD